MSVIGVTVATVDMIQRWIYAYNMSSNILSILESSQLVKQGAEAVCSSETLY